MAFIIRQLCNSSHFLHPTRTKTLPETKKSCSNCGSVHTVHTVVLHTTLIHPRTHATPIKTNGTNSSSKSCSMARSYCIAVDSNRDKPVHCMLDRPRTAIMHCLQSCMSCILVEMWNVKSIHANRHAIARQHNVTPTPPHRRCMRKTFVVAQLKCSGWCGSSFERLQIGVVPSEGRRNLATVKKVNWAVHVHPPASLRCPTMCLWSGDQFCPTTCGMDGTTHFHT